MRELDNIKSFLKNYDGPDVKIMEVCGTHTAAIMHLGIPSMLSEHIRLISGPGCPVCVTVTAYIDKLVTLAMNPSNIIYAFGDLLRVMGSQKSLSMAKADGARVRMVYSPLDMLDAAEKDPEHTHIFAAVGFETTTPVYALLLEEAARRKIRNIKLLTSLKTMPAVIDRLCRANDTNGGSRITGFIAPGHVCAVSGYAAYRMLADKYRLPFVVSGFTGETLLASIYTLVKCAGEPLHLFEIIIRRLYGKRETWPRRKRCSVFSARVMLHGEDLALLREAVWCCGKSMRTWMRVPKTSLKTEPAPAAGAPMF